MSFVLGQDSEEKQRNVERKTGIFTWGKIHLDKEITEVKKLKIKK